MPRAPGGSVDIVARMVATRLSVEFGQQFVVDNRTGAGGTIGAAIVARAAPEGLYASVVSTRRELSRIARYMETKSAHFGHAFELI